MVSCFQIQLVPTCSKRIQEEEWKHGETKAARSPDLQGHICQTCSYRDLDAGLNQRPTQATTVQIYFSS